MKKFYMIKTISGEYRFASHFYRANFFLLLLLLDETWGRSYFTNFLQEFLSQEKPVDDYHTTGSNDVYIEDDGHGFIVIRYEWAEGREFYFPKEKFKDFICIIEEAAKKVYSTSIYESPDLLQFTIDDSWDTKVALIYLNTSKDFFEREDNARPQFRLKRIKGYQYKVVRDSCVDYPKSKTLGMFIEDVWTQPKILDKSIDFKNGQEDGVMSYGRTLLKKEGGQFTLRIQDESSFKSNILLSKEEIHELLVSSGYFLKALYAAPLNKLPGVIFFTFDEYWNLIPVPLFRLADKNFVDKE